MNKLPAPIATATNVTSSASSVTLLAANPNRKGGIITNGADKILHISLVTPATTDSSVADLAVRASAAGPSWNIPSDYTGAIYGIWESGPTGKANITELT